MVFNSDLKFNKELSHYVKVCSDYFSEAKLPQENYDIYSFGAYLGMVLRKSQVSKVEDVDFSKENIRSIPRLILTNNEYNFKELCVCSVYSAAKGKMNKDDLQRVWNIYNYTDPVELSFDEKYEVMKNLNKQAELGLRYLALQIENEYRSDIVDIVESINGFVSDRFLINAKESETHEEIFVSEDIEEELSKEEISLLEKLQNSPKLEKLLDKKLLDKSLFEKIKKK